MKNMEEMLAPDEDKSGLSLAPNTYQQKGFN